MNTGFTVKKHKEGACVSEYVNHVVYIYTLACLVGIVSSVFVRASYILSLCVGFATLFCLPTFWLLLVAKDAKEGFADAAPTQVEEPMDPTRRSGSARQVYDVIGRGLGAAPATLTLPNARNPFMNVLIDEIKYNPTRPMAVSIMDPSVKVGLDEFFRTEFYSDPTDVFGRAQSQRQFVAMPSTSIPNDVDTYQKWLYRIAGKTCKEGGREACLPGTDGAALPWLNAA